MAVASDLHKPYDVKTQQILMYLLALFFCASASAQLAGTLPNGNTRDHQQDALDLPGPGRSPIQSNSSDGYRDFEFSSRWAPLVAFDFDLSRTRIVNLAIHQTKKANPKLVDYDFDNERETLVFDDQASGFKSVFVSKIEGGPGYARIIDLPALHNSAGILPVIGIVPIAGSDVIHVRHHDRIDEAKSFSRFSEFPKNIQAFSSWRTGDSSLFANRGGVVFLVGAGVSGIGVAGIGVAKGEWAVRVEKISDHVIYLKISESKITDFAKSTGAILAVQSFANFKNEDDAFSFYVDLTHPQAQSNYDKIVSGSLAEIQSGLPLLNSGVQFVSSEKMLNSGTYDNFLFGLPLILNQQWNSGFSHAHVERTVEDRSDKVDVEYGIFSKSSKLTAFGTRRARLATFYGAHFRSQDPQSPLSGYFGKMTWEFADNNSNHWQLRQALKDLIRLTGASPIMVNIPTKENLDYVMARFEVELPQFKVNQLLQRLSDGSFEGRTRDLEKQIDEYLKNIDDSDPFDLMPTCGWEAERCRYQIRRESMKNWKKLWQSMAKMKQTQDIPDQFVDAFSEFGECLYTNPFVFQNALKLSGEHTFASIEISGTHLSKIIRRFEFNTQRNIFTSLR